MIVPSKMKRFSSLFSAVYIHSLCITHISTGGVLHVAGFGSGCVFYLARRVSLEMATCPDSAATGAATQCERPLPLPSGRLAAARGGSRSRSLRASVQRGQGDAPAVLAHPRRHFAHFATVQTTHYPGCLGSPVDVCSV